MVSSLGNNGQLQRLGERCSLDLFDEDLPRQQYFCKLDDQPDHLTPEHALGKYAVAETSGALMVNPSCCFTPPEASGDDASPFRDFAEPRNLAWVREPGSEVLLPFWLGLKLRLLLGEMNPGDAVPKNLPSELEFALRIAGIFISAEGLATRRREWLAATSRGAEIFARRGYVPLANLLHPFQVAALRRYYRRMVRTGGMTVDELQTPGRVFVHNESVARFLQWQLTATVAALAGEAVKPSYVYVACYQPGAILKRHIDREQCEFSISLSLDYAPEPRNATPWPLQLHTPSGKTTVFQALGDGLLYRGRQFPHSRDALPPGHSSTSIFFHYVRQNFTGPLD